MQRSQPTQYDMTSLRDAHMCGHGITGFCPDCAVNEEDTQDRVYKERRRLEQIRRNRPIVMSGRD